MRTENVSYIFKPTMHIRYKTKTHVKGNWENTIKGKATVLMFFLFQASSLKQMEKILISFQNDIFK